MTDTNLEQPKPETEQARFQFVRELGRGVLGEAFEVLDEVRGEPVVLKVFARSRPRNPDRFKLEFESLARLEHPSLIRFYHLVDPLGDTNLSLEQRLGQTGLAFTEEYVEGCDLLTYLRQPPSTEELLVLEERQTPTTGDVPHPQDEDLAEEALEEGEGGAPQKEGGEGEVEPDEAASADADEDSPPSQVEADEGPMSIELTIDTGEIEEPATTRVEESAAARSASEIVEEIVASGMTGVPIDLVFLRLERVVPDIVDGLRYLHRYQKVHGNLRPSNILVRRDGRCKLTDYGIIPGLVYRGSGDAESSRAIPLLQAPENLPYVAPESADVASVPGDLYALGCVLYEAIAGHSPFEDLEWTGPEDGLLRPAPLAEVVPSCPSTWADLVDGLLRTDPRKRPSLNKVAEVFGDVEARPVLLPPSVVPEPELFVGREDVLEAIRTEASLCADERRMRLVMLEGETGVGKTAVIEAASHWLARRGWTVIHGQCFNRESLIYQGWHEVAHQIATMIEALPPGMLDELETDRRLAGVLFPQLSPVAQAEHPGAGRLAAIGGFRRLLGAISEQRPLLLVLEDLHWASWDTAALLVDLFAETKGLRCMVVGSWRTDSVRSDEHLLQTDLELSLIDVHRIVLRGFRKQEAREYVIASGTRLSVEEIRSILKTGRFNPRLLQELLMYTREARGAVDELAANEQKELTPPQILAQIYRRRVSELDERERAILNLLAVASGTLGHRWLCHAAESELSSSVLPWKSAIESVEAGLEELVKRGLMRIVAPQPQVEARRYVIAHDLCRSVVLETLSERDRARLSGRLADALSLHARDQTDLRFEYELRAGRVAQAIEPAVDAARAAEARFAFHRAAKLWRWLLEHRSRLPEHRDVSPAAELARVEHLAGQHAEAAELYHEWAASSQDPVEFARIKRRQAAAHLQAGDVAQAIEALDRGLGVFNESYRRRLLAGAREWATRMLAATSRWSGERIHASKVEAATPAQKARADLYYFATDANEWLMSERGEYFGASLARIADRSGDALLLGMDRLKLAENHAGLGIPRRRNRAMQWLEEARAYFERAESPSWQAEACVQEAILHMRYGAYAEARTCLEKARKLTTCTDEAARFDRRRFLYWDSTHHLEQGRLDDAERLARQILHLYRGDRLAAVLAYRLLARIALLRGDTLRARQFVDAGSSSMRSPKPNLSTVHWARVEAHLNIAMGRPEVAVGQLDVLLAELERSRLLDIPYADALLFVSLGQALAAHGERQRVLGEARQSHTLERLKLVRVRLEKDLPYLSNQQRSEVLRLFARIEVLAGRPKKAQREIEEAIALLGRIWAPVQMAKCAEAYGLILLRRERPEARAVVEQALRLYRYCGCSYPLVLEGWPVPRALAALKGED